MIGEDYNNGFMLNSLEEKEAVISMMIENQKKEMFKNLLKDELFDEFVYYEFISKQYPQLILFTAADGDRLFSRIIEYIDRYH
jgi:hypothetical protein